MSQVTRRSVYLLGTLIAITTLVLVIHRVYSTTRSVALSSVLTEGDVIASDGALLHWWKYDRGTELTTVVLHGGPEGTTEWMRVNYGQQLADTFGTTIFYDRRGCGESRKTSIHSESITFNQSGQDLLAVLDATTAPDTKIVLQGHSFGGTLLVHVAPLLGDRLQGVIFSSPFFDIEAELAGRLTVPSHCAQITKESRLSQTPECVPEVYSGWVDNEDYMFTSHLDELAQITVPALLFTGECDVLANSVVVTEAQTALPKMEAYLIPSGSHRGMFDSMESLRPIIETFMQQ